MKPGECEFGRRNRLVYSRLMSIQQLLITEASRQPEPLLREVWHYLNFLKAKAEELPAESSEVRAGFGSVPGIVLAEDFDAPLEDFADYRA
jgi:hypothetical protein